VHRTCATFTSQHAKKKKLRKTGNRLSRDGPAQERPEFGSEVRVVNKKGEKSNPTVGPKYKVIIGDVWRAATLNHPI